ncbi:hypothetical protein HMPREF1640_04480 [Prevotella sp. S7-1-8]|uniref:2-amino-4-hydroxy-6- hydroxymethyldihydropteridine diphosphokinase n=1 Tax=Prevotella sp. S7-1-8 TaxID=1284775 RepID=UPI00050F8175|nr:2-amino-4-hydroxy-6-hydroxymethyldihydropteridine diphosphokinase [Prevotella sp. S7-1-8]KGF18169.1 hypothetical protein HMPREF1640_04480 [Prevotella sp. S7-1-8]
MDSSNQFLLLSLGTNNEQVKHMDDAQKYIDQAFTNVRYSKCIWTAPVGGGTNLYLNRLAVTSTALSYDKVVEITKDIERRLGRMAEDKRRHRVPIDIDVLQLGQSVYHDKDWQRQYVKQLLSDIGL